MQARIPRILSSGVTTMGSDRENPGAPNPNGPNGGPPGLGDRAKTLARASDMLQCRFLTIRILWNLSPKSRKWHFRDSRFKNFPDEHARDPLENSCIYGARLVPLALLLAGLRKFWTGGPWYNVTPLILRLRSDWVPGTCVQCSNWFPKHVEHSVVVG
jgi:hypothetical protein